MKTDPKVLTVQEVGEFMRLIRRTEEHKLDCGECLRHVTEFAEINVAGRPLPRALLAVEHHLSVCPECHEEYLALRRVLEAGL